MTMPDHTHTANMSKVAIQEQDWEILPNPPYSPDLAPSDYHLFRSLSNNLRRVSFSNEDELQNWLKDFFMAKPADFLSVGSKTSPNVGRQS
jgi:transposase